MRIQSRPSINFDSRDGDHVDLLILHYTGMKTADEALARMCDPMAKVSAHYMVEEDGQIWQLVEESKRAWHAGISFWRTTQNVNATSIGVEIVNPGHEWGYRAFPAVQMQAVAELCQGILKRHPRIALRNVIGHSDIAPNRKEDPGELFDWAWLAAQGVGLWPEVSDADIETMRKIKEEWQLPELMQEGDAHNGVAMLQRALMEYGYGIGVTGLFDRSTTEVVRAFQRHFYPEKLDGIWDSACQARLEALLGMV